MRIHAGDNAVLFAHSNWNRYLGCKVKQIDERLKSIKPPDSISRIPRSVTDRSFWKGLLIVLYCVHIYAISWVHVVLCFCFLHTATEFRSFLLYYPVILSGILPDHLVAHLLLLSKAMRILLGESISQLDLNLAQELLDLFGVTSQNLQLKGFNWKPRSYHKRKRWNSQRLPNLPGSLQWMPLVDPRRIEDIIKLLLLYQFYKASVCSPIAAL